MTSVVIFGDGDEEADEEADENDEDAASGIAYYAYCFRVRIHVWCVRVAT